MYVCTQIANKGNMTEKEKWQWQTPGTAWKGAALCM